VPIIALFEKKFMPDSETQKITIDVPETNSSMSSLFCRNVKRKVKQMSRPS